MPSSGHLRADAERNVRSIIEAAIVLLAAEPEASMERVAQAAGVGRATVYRHFASREHLVRAIHDRALQDARDAVLRTRPEEGPAHEALERVVTALLRVGDRYRLLRQVPPGDTELQARADEVGDPMVALVERGQRAGELRTDLPPRWLAAALGSLAVAALSAMIRGELSEDEAATVVCTTFVRGAVVR
jgi:AcrR family transcriptional regulator